MTASVPEANANITETIGGNLLNNYCSFVWEGMEEVGVGDWQVGSWSAGGGGVLHELLAQLVEVHNTSVSFQSPADIGL